MSLDSQTCVPCRGGIPPLGRDDAERYLAQVPGWRLMEEGRRIERDFTFPTYAKAFAFVGRVSDLAEAEGHHPDIRFGWGYATVSLHTHKIGGLHENDFIMAAKINRLDGAAAA